jgi:hypothetical protein
MLFTKDCLTKDEPTIELDDDPDEGFGEKQKGERDIGPQEFVLRPSDGHVRSIMCSASRLAFRPRKYFRHRVRDPRPA